MPTDDLTLVQRVAVPATRAAFRQLVERYQKKVFAVALGMVKDREDAMDVVQEAFVKVHRSLDHFKGRRLVLHLALPHHGQRLHRRHPPPRGTRSDAVEFDERVDHDLAEANLGAVSSQLGPIREGPAAPGDGGEDPGGPSPDSQKHRAILVLREVEGLSYEELAQVLRNS